MRIIKYLFSFLLLSFCIGTIHAVTSETNFSDSSDPTILKRETPRDPNGRPKAPGRQVITCHYDGENLNLDFIYSEGECEVYLTELSTNFSRYYLIDSSELYASIFVGTIKSTAITLTTSNGNTYTGAITVE